MAIIKKKKLKEMRKEELLEKLKELKEELMKIKAQTELKRPIKNVGRIKEIRRTIARILTYLNVKNKK